MAKAIDNDVFQMAHAQGEYSVLQAVSELCASNPGATAEQIRAHLEQVARVATPGDVCNRIRRPLAA